MTAAAVLSALALPPEAHLDQRIPKKLFQEHGAPTAADRRLLQSGIEEARWVATLKPATVGVPAYRDEMREYLEIAVLSVTLRPAARVGRLTELVHRTIPYPVVLVTEQGTDIVLSLAHKRRSQAGADQWVTEQVESTGPLEAAEDDAMMSPFLASLALANQPASNLLATYQGWMDRLVALAAGRVTGHYRYPFLTASAPAVREALGEHARLTREAVALRAQATREKQLARRVELNLAIRRVESRLSDILVTIR